MSQGAEQQPSPWGAEAAAAALGSHSGLTPAIGEISSHGLVSPWGNMFASTALGLNGPPLPPAESADPSAPVSPWGAVLAAAALGLPSMALPATEPPTSEALRTDGSSSTPAAASGGSKAAPEGSSLNCLARLPEAAGVNALTTVSELLFPFHPTNAFPTGHGSLIGGGPGLGSPGGTTLSAGPAPTPQQIGTLQSPLHWKGSDIRPTPFDAENLDPDLSAATPSSLSPALTAISGRQMTGRLASVEPDPSIRFELDWAT